MHIQKAEEKHASEILELIKELAVFEREPDAVEVTLEEFIRDGFSENKIFDTLIALHESKVVGISLYFFKYSTWKGKTMHLEDLIVTEKYRGNGIGEQLLNTTRQIARKEQVARLEWNVLDWNQPAIDFYLKKDADILKEWLLVRMDREKI
ncbi:MAG: GNAT family N-acetyltransferase [Flavobacteriales bacterium]|nr:GNAT family N-acetyltransferase [Flavobacteriales bacterium]